VTYTRWFTAFILCLLIIGSSTAQDNAQPLILLIEGRFGSEGDLWEWTGGPTLRQKTHWEHNSEIRLSPLNNEIAYSSTAQNVVKANIDGLSGGRRPNNIWVIDTESDQAYRTADQPDDASFFVEGVPDKGLVRSSPMWSPDGAQIAWTERMYPDEILDSLMVYDRASQTTRLLSPDVSQYADPFYPLEGVWTDKGIIIYSDTYESGKNDLRALIFDPLTGQQKLSVSIALPRTDSRSLLPWMKMPAQYQGETWLAALYMLSETTMQCNLINLETGEIETCPALPIALIKEHAETSLIVTPFPQDKEFPVYGVVRSDGPLLLPSGNDRLFITRFALSPDGQAIAYQGYDMKTRKRDKTVFVWRDGVITEVPETGEPNDVTEFVWGATTWVIEFSALGQ